MQLGLKPAVNSLGQRYLLNIEVEGTSGNISFTNRIDDLWNSLPNHIVEAKTMFQFENRLDKHWENHPMKYDFTAEYGPITRRKGAVRIEEWLPIEPIQEMQAEST